MRYNLQATIMENNIEYVWMTYKDLTSRRHSNDG